MSAGTIPTPAFPGRVIKAGSTDSTNILAVQRRLNQAGCGPVKENGLYSAETQEAVSLFQVRTADTHGDPLSVDGQVGPMTWAALFRSAVTASAPATGLNGKALAVAGGEVGVMEAPPGSNRGPKVDEYLNTVGLNPASGSFAWCAAFVYWSFKQASEQLGVVNPATKTAGAVDVWNQAGPRGFRRVSCAEATDTPGLVVPGAVFVISTGGGHGHVGFVESVAGVVLTTIEGNTNNDGSREGIGVFRRTGRRINSINLGFVDYSAHS